MLFCCLLSLLYVMTCRPPHAEDHPLSHSLSGAAPIHPSLDGKGPLMDTGVAGTKGARAGPAEGGGPAGDQSYQVLLQEREEQYRLHIASLKKEIAQLKEDLQECSQHLKVVQEALKSAPGGQEAGADSLGGEVRGAKSQQADLQAFLRSQLVRAEVTTGTRLSNEYTVVPFESFTQQKVYQLEMGLRRHPEEKPLRKDKREELAEVLEAALHNLNSPSPQQDGGAAEKSQSGKLYSQSDFIEGTSPVNYCFYGRECVSRETRGHLGYICVSHLEGLLIGTYEDSGHVGL